MSSATKNALLQYKESAIGALQGMLSKNDHDAAIANGHVAVLANFKVALRLADRNTVIAAANACSSFGLTNRMLRALVLAIGGYVVSVHPHAASYLIEELVRFVTDDTLGPQQLVYFLIHTFVPMDWSPRVHFMLFTTLITEYVPAMSNPPSMHDRTARNDVQVHPVRVYEVMSSNCINRAAHPKLSQIARCMSNDVGRSLLTHFCASLTPNFQFGPDDDARVMHGLMYGMALACRGDGESVWAVLIEVCAALRDYAHLRAHVSSMYVLWTLTSKGEKDAQAVCDGVGRSRVFLASAIWTVCGRNAANREAWVEQTLRSTTLTARDYTDMIGVDALGEVQAASVLSNYRSETDARRYVELKLSCRSSFTEMDYIAKAALARAARWGIADVRVASRMRNLLWWLDQRSLATARAVPQTKYLLASRPSDTYESEAKRPRRVMAAGQTGELAVISTDQNGMSDAAIVDDAIKELYFLTRCADNTGLVRPCNAGSVKARGTVKIDHTAFLVWRKKNPGVLWEAGSKFDPRELVVYDVTIFDRKDRNRAVFLREVQEAKMLAAGDSHVLLPWVVVTTEACGRTVLLTKMEKPLDIDEQSKAIDLAFRALLGIPGVNPLGIYTQKGRGGRFRYELPASMQTYTIDENANKKWAERVLMQNYKAVLDAVRAWSDLLRPDNVAAFASIPKCLQDNLRAANRAGLKKGQRMAVIGNLLLMK